MTWKLRMRSGLVLEDEMCQRQSSCELQRTHCRRRLSTFLDSFNPKNDDQTLSASLWMSGRALHMPLCTPFCGDRHKISFRRGTQLQGRSMRVRRPEQELLFHLCCSPRLDPYRKMSGKLRDRHGGKRRPCFYQSENSHPIQTRSKYSVCDLKRLAKKNLVG